MELPFKKIRCDCGKWVAIEKDGELFVWCKNCKKEVKLPKITGHNPAWALRVGESVTLN